MEKIQQAIEKARQQRDSTREHSKISGTQGKEVQAIKYSQTKLMEGQVEHQRKIEF